jgi:hypothetical protein
MKTIKTNNHDEDYSDLFDFLEYMNLKWIPKNLNNHSLFRNYLNIDKSNIYKFINASKYENESSIVGFEKDFYEKLPVALVQLLILILVFLIFLFMCKCNKIMETCRDKNEKETKLFDDDQFNDSMKLKDYFCYLWYNFKLKHCTRRRRRRRFRNRNKAAGRNKNSNNANNHHHHIYGSNSNDEKRRNDSLIFRRRSVIYRNSRSNRKSRPKNLNNNNNNNQAQSNLENIIENSNENNSGLTNNDTILINSPSIQTINEIKNISKAFIDQFEESTIL